tara:strand:+ start:914 stop:1192 length:279 start_codon:yes stop_codon:yes gene_type:complete
MLNDDYHYYKSLSYFVVDDKGKINFFNNNQKAFFLEPLSDNWFNMLKEYAKIEHLSDEKIGEIEEMKWIEIPDSLKIFAFDFCILNGEDFQE